MKNDEMIMHLTVSKNNVLEKINDLSLKDLEEKYNNIIDKTKKSRSEHPILKNSSSPKFWKSKDKKLPTKDAFTMVVLDIFINQIVEKESLQYAWMKLTEKVLGIGEAQDIQSGNKLPSQSGYPILHSGSQFSVNGELFSIPNRVGLYMVQDWTKISPEFNALTRANQYSQQNINEKFFQMKLDRNNACWCCGSIEGECSFRTGLITSPLEMGHQRALEAIGPNNIIPLCSYCNGPNRDDYDFKPNGDKYKRIN